MRDQSAETSLSQAVVPLFQPIYALGRGQVVGFEALARLVDREALVMPSQFLPSLDAEDLLRLFRTMLTRSMSFLRTLGPRGHLYVSVNVNASLVQRASFADLVAFLLDEQGGRPDRLVLEILESEAIDSLEAMATSIRRLQSLGIRVALDDIGSAYASLTNIKDLPVNIVKLDRSFSRLLADRPLDLHFVGSMVGLARRLGRTLIVEGAETPDVVDALRMIGVAYAQGYALGRPMPESAVPHWLSTSEARPAAGGPRTLLGAYAAHLTFLETCQLLAVQPLPVRWQEGADDPHRCGIGRFLDRAGLHDTDVGKAHKRFHQKLGSDDGSGSVEQAAANLGDAFVIALKASVSEAGHRDAREDRTDSGPSAPGGSESVGVLA